MNTTKATPINDYINGLDVIYFGNLDGEDLDDKISELRRLVLDAARDALLSPHRTVRIPGEITLISPTRVQKFDSIEIIPSSQRGQNARDPLTGKKITVDDFSNKKALCIGAEAFHVDNLLLHLLRFSRSSHTEVAILWHPTQNRWLDRYEQISLIAELSLCLSIEDPQSLEHALGQILDRQPKVPHTNEINFLINTGELLKLMKPARIRVVLPDLMAKFTELMQQPHIYEVLNRSPLATTHKELELILLNQQTCKSKHVHDPKDDLLDKRPFLIFDKTKFIETYNKISYWSYQFIVLAGEGKAVRLPSNDPVQTLSYIAVRNIPVLRQSIPAYVKNEKQGENFVDPISLEEIHPGQLTAPHIISIGGYVFFLESCLRRMLSQTAIVNETTHLILHPLENRPLIPAEKMNFFTDLAQKFKLENPTILFECWNHYIPELLERLKKSNGGILPEESDFIFGVAGQLFFDKIVESGGAMAHLSNLFAQHQEVCQKHPFITIFHEEVKKLLAL